MLEEAGISVESRVPVSPQGQNLLAETSEAVRAGDVVVLLLTSAALASPRAGSEIKHISRDMGRRGLDLIPMLAAPAGLPSALDGRGVVDLTDEIARECGG